MISTDLPDSANPHTCEPGCVRTITVRDFDTLRSYYAAWSQLASEMPQQLPTVLPGWVDAYLRHRLKPNESWLCCFAYLGDRLVGVLLAIVTPHPILGIRWPLLSTPFDDHTRSGDIVLAPDCASMALKALLKELVREVPNHLSLELYAVRQNSPIWLGLQNGLEDYIIRQGHQFTYSHLDVRGDFDSYWASLGKMRQDLRRRRKKLERRGRILVEMRKGTDAGEDFLPEFLALEASGWKGRNGSAILNDPDLLAFYTTLVRNFATDGGLEWYAIRVQDRLVAAQLAFRCGTSLMLPKIAYDEDFAEGAPGHL
jgi:CelD/BcsL family acetyltransferase involved in cellulose biosynthesis